MQKMVLKIMAIKIFIIALIAASPFSAHAYIDPNTGGIFFTSVLPFIYGLLAAVVIFWKRIILFVKGLFSKKKEDDES